MTVSAALCVFSRRFKEYLRVQGALQKAYAHVQRMQAKKPNARRDALDAAERKLSCVRFAFLQSSRKLEEVREFLREYNVYYDDLCICHQASCECHINCRKRIFKPSRFIRVVKEEVDVVPESIRLCYEASFESSAHEAHDALGP